MKAKANTFSTFFFASKCLAVNIDPTLPMSVMSNSTISVNEINVNDEELLKIIQGLDINQAYGHEDLSVRMIIACNGAIIGALLVVLNNCILTDVFPKIYKNSNVVLLHKEGDKQIVDFFYLILGCPTVLFGLLLKGQLH